MTQLGQSTSSVVYLLIVADTQQISGGHCSMTVMAGSLAGLNVAPHCCIHKEISEY